MRIALGENARMALNTLHENKMRSFLTVLGVVIGITALLSVVAVLMGVYNDVNAFLSDFGSDTIFIFKFDPGIHTSGRLTPEERSRKPLTLEDAEAIGELCPDVKAVSAAVMPKIVEGAPGGRPLMSARYKDKEVAGVDYHGILPEDEEVFNSRAEFGRFITEVDNLHRRDVALIGPDIAKALYPDEDAIGKPILVDGVSYEVIGVMAARKGQLVKDQAADKAILVPYRTYQKHRPGDDENLIGARAYPGRMPEAEDEIRGVLRRRRRVPFDKPDNFGVSSAKEIADQFRQITSSVALLISVVSSIGLLVGGVGVMNIMLMSVTQRTREIGVRKAIGARKRDILMQFTLEAVMLTAVGGVIGLAVGAIITAIVPIAFPSLPATMSMYWSMFAFAASAAVGLVFGIYPAWKASNLDPIESLRYE
jgi:putative ABC transport system permease protein